MKRFLPVLLLTVSLVCSLAFSIIAEVKPNPIVISSNVWYPTTQYIHFGNNSALPNSEGVGVKPSYFGNNYFSQVYMRTDQADKDPYVAGGYYNAPYSMIFLDGASAGQNTWYYSTGSFMDTPNVFMLDREERTLQPGGAIEFYVYVGNCNLVDYSDVTHYYNRIGGVAIGYCSMSSSGIPVNFASIDGIETEVIAYQGPNYNADAVNQRLVHLVRIVNNSNEVVPFNGIRLTFMYTDIVGNPIQYVQTGYKGCYIYLGLSPVMMYNTTSRDQEYLDSIGGTIGNIDDKFDQLYDKQDAWYENWNNAQWNGIFDPNLSYQESELKALSDFRTLKNLFVDNLEQMNLVDGAGFWQSIYSMIVGGAPYIGLLAALSGVLIVTKALLGR